MSLLIPLIVIGGGGFVLCTVLALRLPAGESRWLIRWLTIALFLRLGLATGFELVREARIYHDDADGYEIVGMAMADGWRDLRPPIDMTLDKPHNYGYFYVAGAVYYVLGNQPMAAAAFNALLGTLLVLLAYLQTRMVFHPAVARRTVQLTALFPSLVLWSAIASKDTAVTFLVSLAVYSCMRLKERFSLPSLLGIVVSLAAVWPIRYYMLYFAAMALLGAMVVAPGLRAATGFVKQAVTAGALALVLVVVGVAGSAQESASGLTLERAAGYRAGMARGAESGFGRGADTSTAGGALGFLPLGMAVLLFGPFPWQFTSARSVAALPELLIWWSFVPALWAGLRFAVRWRFDRVSPMVLFAALLTPAYALVAGNVGTAFRMRAQIVIYLLAFVAVGQFLARCRKTGVDPRRMLTP